MSKQTTPKAATARSKEAQAAPKAAPKAATARSKQAQAAPKAATQAQVASPLPTVARPVAPATNAQGVPSATLRGLPAQVAINPAQVYRSKAAHNMHWWANVQAACAKGPASTAALLAGAQGSVAGSYTAATGAPGHFVGYAVRRGYLVAV